MDHITTYLQIMIDSLKKKVNTLDELIRLSMIQNSHLSQDALPIETFEEIIDKKERALKMIEELDMGFEKVYSRISTQLMEEKHRYRIEIETMQSLLKDIINKGVTLKSIESNNKKSFSNVIGQKKEDYQLNKNNYRFVKQYNQSVNFQNFDEKN